MTFTPADATLTLIPEVRSGMSATDEEGREVRLKGVTEAVDSHFGTLTDPTVWPLLPIEFGGEPAAVVRVAESSVEAAAKAEEAELPLEEVTLVLAPVEGELAALDAGSQVGWTAGTYEGKSHRVKAFDPKTGAVTLTGLFVDGLPEEGDELFTDAGGTLREGRALYARHCLHCHGPGGAGNGPTAKYLSPKPRDFRLGKVKFTSTGSPEKASRADLRSTLERGIPGTSMPAFRLLSDDQLDILVEYVRWLAIRGEYENQLAVVGRSSGFSIDEVQERIRDGESREEIVEEEVKEFMEYDFAETIEYTGEDVAGAWSDAEDDSAAVMPTMPRVADTAESRARGRELFLSDKTKCASCHGVYGKGDGPQTTTFQPNQATGENYPEPGLHDDWGNVLQPRDLTQGIYRGGRRPIDLYRRIYVGIKGTPMAGFGGNLSEEEIWHVVNYVLNAPYETLPEPGEGKALVSTGH
ncbi:MAG: cytochrome c [Planctomycetaceae bacterium]